MKTKQAINFLSKVVSNPKTGLPEDVFLFLTRMTPMVNVDLLIKNKKGHTLLAWRDDFYSGKGWHVPGGIIRFQETLENRINKVAELEIGTKVKFDPTPIAINQIIDKKLTARSHFISVLYNCRLPEKFEICNEGRTSKDPGFLAWHKVCPKNIIKYHYIYRNYIGKT